MRAAFFHGIGSYILLPVAEANSDATLLYIDESTADLRHNNVKKLLEETYGSESVRRKFIPEFSRWREDIEKRLTNEDAHEKALLKTMGERSEALLLLCEVRDALGARASNGLLSDIHELETTT